MRERKKESGDRTAGDKITAEIFKRKKLVRKKRE